MAYSEDLQMIDLHTCSDCQVLPTAEVAEALRISPAAVRKAVRDGRLAAIGGFRVFYISAKATRDFVRANGMVLSPIAAQPVDDEGDVGNRAMEMKR
jgi:hypothetical protein